MSIDTVSQADKDLLRQEMLEDAYRDQEFELKMRNDYDFALEHFSDDIQEAYEILEKVCKSLEGYGYEFTPSTLIATI